MDSAKIQVIRDLPTLPTLTEFCNFFCLANFYRRFVLGFSHITSPFSQVTKGEAKEKFFWFESIQKAFVELKHRLCSAPTFTFLDLQQPFEIQTDASTLHQYSHCQTYKNHLKLRQTPLTMLLVQFSLSKDIRWPITMRHFLT